MEVTGHSFVPGSAYATVHLALEDNVADISTTRVRLCVIENDCLFGSEAETDVLRDIVADVPVTINTAGQTQDVTGNFTMDPLWNAATCASSPSSRGTATSRCCSPATAAHRRLRLPLLLGRRPRARHRRQP